MPTEKSAGAVIFRIKEGEIYYLLLHYQTNKRRKRHFWDFTKGHIEKGEDEETAAKREIKEETGLTNITFVNGFKEKINYSFKIKDKIIFKTVIFFLAQAKREKIIISFEHEDFRWLSFKEALKLLTFKNGRNILTRANNCLNKKYATFSRNK
jgi:8-oxo-dGTP pyrophosphatase MutT (NUDIX family)